mgnify:CR=1 FL=1
MTPQLRLNKLLIKFFLIKGTNGNVGIGITNPSEELHIYDAGSDPYVLVDGSGGNRDSGYKINAGNGVKIAARADNAGNMYFADNAISFAFLLFWKQRQISSVKKTKAHTSFIMTA